MHGWTGTILRVNLEKRKIRKESTFSMFKEDFIGARGIGYRIMWNEVDLGKGALDPENKMIFAVGPLGGIKGINSNRTVITTKGPQVYPQELTTYSTMGGGWAGELKRAGYDAVIIEGKAKRPVYVLIDDERVEIREADHLWGLDTGETQRMIRKDLGKPVQIACIGPAGENLVRFSCIIHGNHHAAGGGGFGAVMGSKRLKAVAVKGTKEVSVADPKGFVEAAEKARYLMTMVGATPRSKGVWNEGVDPYLPLLTNDHRKRYNLARVYNPKYGESPFIVGNTGCGNCPNKCRDVVKIPGGLKTTMMCANWFYSRMGKNGPEAFLFHELCNKYGLDIYVPLFYIPWLNELHADKVLGEKDLPFSAFPGEGYVTGLIEKIVFRDGIGDILAEGPPRAAKKLGVYDDLVGKEFNRFGEGVSPYFAPGLPGFYCSYGGRGFMGHWDPRDYSVYALMWALSTRDPLNNSHEYLLLTTFSGFTLEEQKAVAARVYGSEGAIHPLGKPKYDEEEAKAAIIVENRSVVKDEITLCDWSWPIIYSPLPDTDPPFVGDTSLESKLVSSAVGRDLDEDCLLREGERTYTLGRAITIREWGRRDMKNSYDILPDHFYTCRKEGINFISEPIKRDKFEAFKEIYYHLRGWDVSLGLPRREKLEELDLREVADGLEKEKLLP